MPKFFHEPWANQIRAAEIVTCPKCGWVHRPRIIGTDVSQSLRVRVMVQCLAVGCHHQWSTLKVSLPSRRDEFPLSWFDNPGPDEVSEERVKDDARIASRFGLRIN